MTLPRSFLYVPADRADRLAKAHTRGADAIIADLEDGVAPEDKDKALANVESWLSERSALRPTLWVRLNVGERGLDEATILCRLPALAGLLLPKVESSDDVQPIHQRVGVAGRPVLLAPMIESAAAVVRVAEIASAPGVHQVHMGEVDLAADLGLHPAADDLELNYARSRVVVASRFARLVPPVGGVNTRIDDPTRFAVSTRALSRLGFRGRDCIHPTQVTIANAVFTPDSAKLVWAHEVLARAGSERGSFRDARGAMIDEAVLRRARNIIQLSAGPD